MLETTMLICSKPTQTAARCKNEQGLDELVRTSLLLVLGCTAAFGFVLGNTRDFMQGLSAALKLPLVWIVTLSVCTPALYAIAGVLGQGLRLRALMALILAATARASLLLFAMLPILWFLSDLLGNNGVHYHRITMAAAMMFALAGFSALGVLLRAFDKHRSRPLILSAFVFAFFMVAGQTAWSLRPFVGRPAETDTPWFRAPEGTFLEAVWRGSDSARGIYSRSAPPPSSHREAADAADAEQDLREY